MLEALMATSVFALLAIAFMPALISSAQRPEERLRSLEMTEFARSFFDTVEVTGELFSDSATYERRFRYRLEITDQPTAAPSRFDSVIALKRMDLNVVDLIYGGSESFVKVIAHEF